MKLICRNPAKKDKLHHSAANW